MSAEIDALIVTRARKVRRVTMPLDHRSLFDGSLYCIDASTISIKIDGLKVKGPEVVLFEGVPDPVGFPDNSKSHGEAITVENLIDNVTDPVKRGGINKWWIIVPLALIVVGGGLYYLYTMGYFNALLGLG